MAGKRRKARIITLKALYEIDTAGHDPEQTLGRLLEQDPTPPAVAEFARHLLFGVRENSKPIDAIIAQTAPAWPVEQVAAVDRNILRLAIFEILFNNMTPVRAAINEAVELAKAFGSDSSPKFVNGVLGSVSLMATR